MKKIAILILLLFLISGCAITDTVSNKFTKKDSINNTSGTKNSSNETTTTQNATIIQPKDVDYEKILEDNYKKCLAEKNTEQEKKECYQTYLQEYRKELDKNREVIDKAISTDDLELCMTVTDEKTCQQGFKNAVDKKEHDRQEELFNKSLATNDINLCLTLSQHKSICNRVFGIKNNDTKLCLEIKDSLDGDWRTTDRYTCLNTIAVNIKDEEVCNLIKQYVKDKWDGLAYSSCKTQVLAVKQKEITSGLTDEQITERAIKENNFDLCLAISHGEHYANCQLEVAKTNNMTYCEKIIKGSIAYNKMLDCYEFYGYKINREFYLYNADDEDKDKLFDYLEKQVWKTDENNPDTDGDGYLDGDEIRNGYDPLKP